MKTNFHPLLLLNAMVIAMSLCISSCVIKTGNKKTVEEGQAVFEVDSFDRIDFSAFGEVEFTIADKPSVTIIGDKDFIDTYSVKSQDGRLEIKQKSRKLVQINTPKMILKITSPTLHELSMSGAGTLHLKDVIKTDDLRITMEGAGNMKSDRITCDALNVNVSGAGNVEFDGVTANTAYIVLEGVGNVDAGFTDTGSLSCVISGVGNISLKGNVKSFEKKNEGVGHIDTGKLKIG